MPVEILAAMVSGATYGAAREWVHTPGRCSAETMADAVVRSAGAMMTAEHELDTQARVS